VKEAETLRTLILTTAAIAALSPCAHAADVEELVVTATRLPTRPELVTGARVIGRGELESRGVPFATEALSTLPGVGIARTGAFGGVAAIRIRGAAPDKTLVLIDGAPSGDPADPSGTFDPSSLLTADLERIEVLSGPQGSLWGSEAIGGVVAFTTRELDGLRAEAEAGAFQTLRAFAGAGVAEGRYAISASVAGFRSDGVSKAASGAEDDGFETFTASLGGRVNAGGVRLDGRLRYTDSEIEIDGFPPPAFRLADTADENRSRAWSGFVRAGGDLAGLAHTLSLSVYDLERRNVSAFPSRFDAERRVLRWTAEADHLVIGAERQGTEADLSRRVRLDLSNTAAFAVGRAGLGRMTLTGSVRHDDPEAYGSRTTGRLAAALDLTRGFTLTASAGTGFKTPTISQVACDFCFAPPVALRPERAEGWDIRFGWSGDRASAAVTGYRLLVRDQIAFRAGRYVNIAKTSTSGLEAELQAQLTEALGVRLAYAWTDAVDRAANASLIRVPDHAGAAALFWEQGDWSAALTMRAESSQSDIDVDGFTPVRRRGFVTADASAAYAISERISLTARVENLTDRRYQETFGYGEPGRAVYVGVRLRN
jgi:vitamin B12 transporter